MDTARDIHTQEPVEAEDLRQLTNVDPQGYECHGHNCRIPAIPCSYGPNNVVRPYFKYLEAHGAECDVVAETALVALGNRTSVRSQLLTSPGLSPAKLHLVDIRYRTEPGDSVDDNVAARRRSGINARRPPEPRPPGRRAANSIRAICRAFLRFPHDRDLSLTISGVDASSYQTAFKFLHSSTSPLSTFPRKRIFFARMSWKEPITDDMSLTIRLDAGSWADRKLTCYKLIVDWSTWSQTARTRLMKELEIARLENREADKSDRAKEKPAKGASSPRTYVFFLGDQDSEDPSLFHVEDARLLCTVNGTLLFPKS